MDDAFCQGVVAGTSDAADGGVDARLGQPLGVSDRQVLAASITMMDQFVSLGRPLWQMAWFRASRTVSDQRATGSSAIANGGHRRRDAPADDLAGEDVGERDLVRHWFKNNGRAATQTMPCQLETWVKSSSIGLEPMAPAWTTPELVRHIGDEGTVHLVVWAGLGRIRVGCDDRSATDNTL